MPRWEQRIRAPRVLLPDSARGDPTRSVVISDETGVTEVYAWDRRSDHRRRVTDRPKGTSHARPDFTGDWVWWYRDTDGDELGSWVRQPFTGGRDEEVAPGLPPSYSSGLAFAATGQAVVGCTADEGSEVLVVRPGSEPVPVYAHREYAEAADISRDGTLVAVAHSEHGDARHPALRVLRPDGTTVADLWDGPGRSLQAVGFAPVEGDPRLLVLHERAGTPRPLLWDPVRELATELGLDVPGETRAADWYPDATAVLLVVEHEGRTQLYRHDLTTTVTTRLQTPPGFVDAARTRPDGSVEYRWSSAAEPPEIRSTGDGAVLRLPAAPAPASVPAQDVWAEGPGGPVHALLSVPEAGAAPYPAVFWVHGGPTWADRDEFGPTAAAFVDHGYAVVRVNYRGSTGYGAAWRDAIEADIGLTELADIAAVRKHLVGSGTLDTARTVLAGGSWGGYLTLLGLGTQPDAWAAGVAWVPVADFVAAYEDEAESLRAFDRSLFGGSPAEVPDRYERSSPITYAEMVRVPLFVGAGENDPRCPIRQIENYLARLDELGHAYEEYRFDAGHGSLVVDEQVRQTGRALEFIRRHVP